MRDGTPSNETTDAANGNGHSFEDSAFKYQRLRSPKQHQQTLQVPKLNDVDGVWAGNLENQSSQAGIGDHSLFDIQSLGRKEIVELATEFTQSYCDIDLSDRSANRIVMAGHQPELFHPGVWYKNFVLSELGSRFNATAINLVVDNDICGSTSIRFPKIIGKNASVGTIPIVAPGPNLPFETRTIDDLEFFRTFQFRAADSVRNLVKDPIVNRLWPTVMQAVPLLAGDSPPKLGLSMAAGRHRLEHEIGLRTLEVPISRVSQTKSFAIFVKSILLDVARFRSIYNQSLSDYRQVYRIRSRSHPVPELEIIDRWQEIPFWVWNTDHPNRRRLFTQQVQGRILLSDRVGWQTELEPAFFVEQFCELAKQGIAIRPRALMTTMFSRLILSDLFLHGIGGAKYDQLTDVIMEQFYFVESPGFLTLSATMKLPTTIPIVRKEDLVRTNQLIRDFKFHPESHIAQPTGPALELIHQKRDWTIGEHKHVRSKQKHDTIASLNSQLVKFVDTAPDELLARRSQLSQQVRTGEILDSREYSFCLFPESLMANLKSLSNV